MEDQVDVLTELNMSLVSESEEVEEPPKPKRRGRPPKNKAPDIEPEEKPVRDLPDPIEYFKRNTKPPVMPTVMPNKQSENLKNYKNENEKLNNPPVDRKATLLANINAYYNYFPALEKTNPRKGGWTHRCSIEDLQAEVERCKCTLNSMNAYNTCCKLDIGFNLVIEHALVNIMGIPVHGLAKEAKESQAILEQELLELSIKYESFFSMSPETRYLIKSMQRIYMLMDRNYNITQKRRDDQYRDAENKYGDL